MKTKDCEYTSGFAELNAKTPQEMKYGRDTILHLDGLF